MPSRRRERDFLVPECFVKDTMPYGSSRRLIVKVNKSLYVPKAGELEVIR